MIHANLAVLRKNRAPMSSTGRVPEAPVDNDGAMEKEWYESMSRFEEKLDRILSLLGHEPEADVKGGKENGSSDGD